VVIKPPLAGNVAPVSQRASTAISDMITLIACNSKLYLAIEEVKYDRYRAIRGITLQTTDPADE